MAKIARFARSLSDLLRMLEYLDRKGIGFVSVNDPGIEYRGKLEKKYTQEITLPVNIVEKRFRVMRSQ